jgi:viroplasmin and RNaseH domain-containing protein
MIIDMEYLRQLANFYAIANGWKTGIFGDWETAEKFISGFSNPEHKRCKTAKEAVNFVFEGLLLRAKVESLKPDELETLDSCKRLVDRWKREAEAESLI